MRSIFAAVVVQVEWSNWPKGLCVSEFGVGRNLSRDMALKIITASNLGHIRYLRHALLAFCQ